MKTKGLTIYSFKSVDIIELTYHTAELPDIDFSDGGWVWLPPFPQRAVYRNAGGEYRTSSLGKEQLTDKYGNLLTFKTEADAFLWLVGAE
jgi:hypothetical protein